MFTWKKISPLIIYIHAELLGEAVGFLFTLTVSEGKVHESVVRKSM